MSGIYDGVQHVPGPSFFQVRELAQKNKYGPSLETVPPDRGSQTVQYLTTRELGAKRFQVQNPRLLASAPVGPVTGDGVGVRVRTGYQARTPS